MRRKGSLTFRGLSGGESVAAAFWFLRTSYVGKTVRRCLPVSFKRSIHRAVVRIAPTDRSWWHSVVRAITVTDSLEFSAVFVPRVPAASDAKKPKAPLSSSGVDLVLVVSFPRSGTEAFMSLLKAIPTGWEVEEEFFSGYMRESTLRLLKPDFPWIEEVRRGFDANQSAHDKSSIARAYRDRMNVHAMEVTERILSLRRGSVAMKVFPHHLDWSVLDAIIDRFQPRVVVLRRRMIFSYVSILKGHATGVWFSGDNSAAPLMLEHVPITQYIAEADAWFDHAFRTCMGRGAPWVDVDFEGVVESTHQRETLFGFLGIDPRWRDLTPGTRRQDLRTDASLVRTLEVFRGLSWEEQDHLMRLPGPRPSWLRDRAGTSPRRP